MDGRRICIHVERKCLLLCFTELLLFFIQDVDGIKYVINFDYPQSSEDYIHRIGRTGRSETKGTSYAFFTKNNARQSKALVDVLREANQEISPALEQMVRNNRGGFGDNRRYGGGGGGGSRFGGTFKKGLIGGGGSRFGGSSGGRGGGFGGGRGGFGGENRENGFGRENGGGFGRENGGGFGGRDNRNAGSSTAAGGGGGAGGSSNGRHTRFD